MKNSEPPESKHKKIEKPDSMKGKRQKTFGCAWPSKKLPRGDHAEVTPIPPVIGGGEGVTKTLTKLSQHFFWPGMRKSANNYCQSCHVCEVIGKQNQKPAKAHLKQIPARIVIDCVGPLSKSDEEYLLTIMCAST